LAVTAADVDISDGHLESLIDEETVEAVQLGLSHDGPGLVTINIPGPLVPLLRLSAVDGGRLLGFLLGHTLTSNIFQELPDDCDTGECYIGDGTRYVQW